MELIGPMFADAQKEYCELAAVQAKSRSIRNGQYEEMSLSTYIPASTRSPLHLLINIVSYEAHYRLQSVIPT
jgi:hypothetical protein